MNYLDQNKQTSQQTNKLKNPDRDSRVEDSWESYSSWLALGKLDSWTVVSPLCFIIHAEKESIFRKYDLIFGMT